MRSSPACRQAGSAGGENSCENEKCGKERRNFSFNRRNCIDNQCLFHFGSFSVDSRANRTGGNSYGHIWILTLKRICAEGLQQIMHGRGKGLSQVHNVSISRIWWKRGRLKNTKYLITDG